MPGRNFKPLQATNRGKAYVDFNFGEHPSGMTALKQGPLSGPGFGELWGVTRSRLRAAGALRTLFRWRGLPLVEEQRASRNGLEKGHRCPAHVHAQCGLPSEILVPLKFGRCDTVNACVFYRK